MYHTKLRQCRRKPQPTAINTNGGRGQAASPCFRNEINITPPNKARGGGKPQRIALFVFFGHLGLVGLDKLLLDVVRHKLVTCKLRSERRTSAGERTQRY